MGGLVLSLARCLETFYPLATCTQLIQICEVRMQIVDKDPSVTEHVMKLGSKVLTFQQTKGFSCWACTGFMRSVEHGWLCVWEFHRPELWTCCKCLYVRYSRLILQMPVWSFPIQGSFAIKNIADGNWLRISAYGWLRQGVADLRSSTINIVEEVASTSRINAGLAALFKICRRKCLFAMIVVAFLKRFVRFLFVRLLANHKYRQWHLEHKFGVGFKFRQ